MLIYKANTKTTKNIAIFEVKTLRSSICPLVRDSSRTLTSQIIYTDKNTSGIRPKPLNKEQTERFFDILLGNNSILNAPNPTENNAISKDHPSSK